MLQHKDTHSLSEIKNRIDVATFSTDSLLQWLRFFKFKKVYEALEKHKSQGFYVTELLSLLIALPFLNKTSVYSLLHSGHSYHSPAAKDAYYRLLNNSDIDWLGLLENFVLRFVKILSRKSEKTEASYLILDDTLLPKRGRFIEGVSKLWDHVSHFSVLGHRLLQLGYYDGKSFVPVRFSIHREKGKNPLKPYGLSQQQFNEQYTVHRPEKSAGSMRALLLDKSKIEMGIEMVKRACKKMPVTYLLADSWFTSLALIKCALSCKIHLIGMMKMGNALYTYKGQELTSGQLVQRLAKTAKRSRKLKAHYIEADVTYKGIEIKLFLSKFGKNGKWQLLLTTDLKLNYSALIKHYQVRWTIEVYFKECKQYLNLGGCQSQSLDAQYAHATIAMIQYILLTLAKRFGEYESKGAVFRQGGENLAELTLQSRLWGLLLELVQLLVELLELVIEDIDQLLEKIINQEKILNFFPALE